MSAQFDPILGQMRDGAVTLAEQTAGYNKGSAAEKAAFQSSVSGGFAVFAALIMDNATDNTAPLVAAIARAVVLKNSARSSLTTVTVELPPGTAKIGAVSIPSGVRLHGNSTELVGTPTSGYLLTLHGNATIENVKINANPQASSTTGGVNIATDGFHAKVLSCNFDGVAGRAIYDQGLASTILDVLSINALQNTSVLTDYDAGIVLEGNDGWVDRVETSTRGALGLSAGGYSCALKVNGANYQVDNVIAETSDHGIYLGVGCTQFKSNGCRGELCYGNGWLLAGGGGRITDASSLRNSLAGNALYDSWKVIGVNSCQYTVVNFFSEGQASGAKPNYGISDQSFNQSQYNVYIHPRTQSTNNGFVAHGGASFIFASRPPLAVTGGGAVNFGAGHTNLKWANTTATSVTGIDNSVDGQRLLMRGDGFTTIANNTNIQTLSGADTLLTSGTWYEFIRDTSKWYQIR